MGAGENPYAVKDRLGRGLGAMHACAHAWAGGSKGRGAAHLRPSTSAPYGSCSLLTDSSASGV